MEVDGEVEAHEDSVGARRPDVSVEVFVVDAANVVGSRPDGWWRDRAAAAAGLVDRLAGLGEPVEVVLEGRARDGVPAGCVAGTGVRVHHAPGDGDDLLAVLCRPGAVLVTADRALAARGRAAGAQVVRPRALLDRLDALGPGPA